MPWAIHTDTYICVYIHTYIYINISIYAHLLDDWQDAVSALYTHTSIYVYTYTNIYIYTHIYLSIYILTCLTTGRMLCALGYTHTHTYVYGYIHTHIYIDTHISIYLYIFNYMRTCLTTGRMPCALRAARTAISSAPTASPIWRSEKPCCLQSSSSSDERPLSPLSVKPWRGRDTCCGVSCIR